MKKRHPTTKKEKTRPLVDTTLFPMKIELNLRRPEEENSPRLKIATVLGMMLLRRWSGTNFLRSNELPSILIFFLIFMFSYILSRD